MEQGSGHGAANFPLLRFLTEADIRRPVNLKPSERPKVDCIGVEAIDPATRLDAEGESVTSHGGKRFKCASFKCQVVDRWTDQAQPPRYLRLKT